MGPGLLAEIERVVKVLSSRMQRPTQSTNYRTQRKMSRAAAQKLLTDIVNVNDCKIQILSFTCAVMPFFWIFL